MSAFSRIVRILLIIVVIFYIYQHFFAKNKDPLLTLAVTSAPRIVQLTNQSAEAIWLDVADHAPGAKAGYASSLDPHHSSLFYLANGPLTFVCYQGLIGVTNHQVVCHDVLQLHEKAAIAEKGRVQGNYWLRENVTDLK